MTNPQTPLNIALLRKVIAHIKAEPSRLYMHEWIISNIDESHDPPFGIPSCGTAACLAGWAWLLEGHKKWQSSDKVRKLLGISELEGERLFYSHNWPARFRSAYAHAEDLKDGQEAVRVLEERVEYFIKTRI